jgi:Family of unknown function (DUF6455)
LFVVNSGEGKGDIMSSSRPILAKPNHRGSMGGMMMILDIDPAKLCKNVPGRKIQQVISSCLLCPTDDVCGRWLRDPDRRKDAYRAFCPNADVFDRVRNRK